MRTEIPLSVCIVDMDWHITKTGNASDGWTGYTWNRELVPGSAGLHPLAARAGAAHRAQPAPGAGHPSARGAIPGHGAAGWALIPAYRRADPLRHRRSAFRGGLLRASAPSVRSRWASTSGGWTGSRARRAAVPGLDPLWWLNHLHFYDLGRDGRKRPFIFSRWGGLGNHRYPIGFSGDTVVRWAALAFQPYFTATAANVGYGWWSHDIGGHMFEDGTPELYPRWVQFGVFSPILRLHCTNKPALDRRPWGKPERIFKLRARPCNCAMR